MKKNNLVFSIIIYTFIFFVVFPIMVLFIWSFAKNWSWPYVVPKNLGLRGFKYVLDPTGGSLKVLLRSVLIAVLVTFITIVISIPAAKALGIYQFKGKNLIKLIILLPIIIPPISIALGIHVAFIKLNIANTFIGVVIIHLIPCIPYAVTILTDVFELIGNSMEQQARILGANKIQCFFYVTLPIISPGIMSASFMVFIISFSQYFLTFLIGGGQVVTYPILMFPFIQSGDRTIAASYSVIFIITSLIFLFIIEKAIKKFYKTDKFLNI
ncbi:ABC transporter permease subunit [Clostridium niameyense]|uniref:ABC transporter permease subunit n=1 Tax=Clostridium niameyense TaxID=1622073 RepID=A0A6M0R9Q3_9CLOT|nr:ABC transporter permease subunit [Clostridium niameyense]NEZ46926.1 ABC transporter permease subunit [Clostridium niameyense]